MWLEQLQEAVTDFREQHRVRPTVLFLSPLAAARLGAELGQEGRLRTIYGMTVQEEEALGDRFALGAPPTKGFRWRNH